MEIKIKLPDELRTRIKDFLVGLDEAVARSPETQAGLTEKICKLEGDAAKLTNQIEFLRVEAVTSDDAAANLNTKKARLQAVNLRLEEMHETIARLKPPTLAGAGELLVEVTRFYGDELPDQIADYLRPICPTRHIAMTIAKMCDSHKALMGIRNWSYEIDGRAATPGDVNPLKDILKRALRGQPHLGADVAESVKGIQ